MTEIEALSRMMSSRLDKGKIRSGCANLVDWRNKVMWFTICRNRKHSSRVNVSQGSLLHFVNLPLLLVRHCLFSHLLTGTITPLAVWISANQQIGAMSSREKMEKITSSWWPCSLPPPPLWLHLNCISSQICLLPVKVQLLCLKPQQTILLILFPPYPSYPSPSFLPHCWWLCNLLYQELKDTSSLFTPPHNNRVTSCRQSLAPLISPHSPWLIFCVWYSQPLNPPLHSGWTWHCRLCSNQVHIIPTNCTFQVTWNGSLSKPCRLETGVSQGSILGPLLFSLYTR